jgi:hypothetical protein
VLETLDFNMKFGNSATRLLVVSSKSTKSTQYTKVSSAYSVSCDDYKKLTVEVAGFKAERNLFFAKACFAARRIFLSPSLSLAISYDSNSATVSQPPRLL